MSIDNNSKKRNIIYLDNAASTPIDNEVIEEMMPFISNMYGNPSSLHHMGRQTKLAILKSRNLVAKSIAANINEIYFTSGGTESNNLALIGSTKLIKETSPSNNQIVVSEIEHDSILETVSYLEKEMRFEVKFLRPNKDGIIDKENLKEAITQRTGLVSIMLVNNEIGTIQPIRKLVEVAKQKNKNVIFHTDAVQALGKIPVNVNDLGVDLLSLSSHKINGPKGAGALYIRHGLNLYPILFGGGQEKKLRSGTENVYSIVGFGKACEIIEEKINKNKTKTREIQEYAIDRITKEIKFSRLNGSDVERVPNNINFSFLGVNGEDLLIKLDEKGIASSTGSACSSNKKQKASHVLKALGLSSEEITGSIRLSLDHHNTMDEMEVAITKLKEIIEEMRRVNEFKGFIKGKKKTAGSKKAVKDNTVAFIQA
ncbi:MAG: cysteine desulfurase [Thermoproteota archaeon]|nr:cysteine desulfurase [Thermoproteota archaeon]